MDEYISGKNRQESTAVHWRLQYTELWEASCFEERTRWERLMARR